MDINQIKMKDVYPPFFGKNKHPFSQKVGVN